MKTALITGASSGIGYELAKVLARENYNLILVARRRDRMEELKKQLDSSNRRIDIITQDLSIPGAALELYNKTQDLGIKVDCLINNAGFGAYGEFAKIDLARQSEMIQLNVTTLTELTHLYLQNMKNSNSCHIVNIASTAAFQPGPRMAVYFATKAYVLSFSEALSEELNGTGVFVTAICPGPTDSGFANAAEMASTAMFDQKSIPSSQDVAEFTLQAIKKKTVVAVHGFTNWLLTQSNRFAPRSAVRKIAAKVIHRN